MRQDRLLSRAFLLCAVANFLQSLAWNLYLHLPGFLHDKGASEVEIGVLSAASAVAAIAARPPLATLLDRGSRVRIARTAAAFDAVVCALHLTVAELGPWIYALRIAHGLAEAALFTTLFTIAADLVPPSRRTEGLALYSASGMLPIAIGGVLGDAILASGPYATLFGVSAALAAAAFAASLAVPDRRQAAAPGAARSGGFLAALAQRDLAPLWMIGAVFGVALAGVFTFVKRYAMETEVASVGAFFSAYVGAAIAVRLLGGSVPDRVGPRRLLPVALALLAAGIGFLALATSERTVLASGLLCGVGHGFAYPMLSSLVVARARDHERGAAISVLTSLPDVGALVGAPLAGAILEATGFATMFAVSAAVLAAGTVLFALWDRG
jgi:MFS family permease